MYRFDDKQRKRLLEDALVAELFDGVLAEQPNAEDTQSSGSNATSTVAASAVATGRVPKRSA